MTPEQQHMAQCFSIVASRPRRASMVRPRFKKAETLDLDRILHIHQLSQPSSVVQAGWHRNGATNAPHDQTPSPALAPSWSWT
jgi:hypothetical protein